MKSASQIMAETNSNEIGLALIFIEHERQLCNNINSDDKVEIARQGYNERDSNCL